MPERILHLVILRRGLRDTPNKFCLLVLNQFSSFQFNLIFIQPCCDLYRSHWGSVADVCVFHFREPSVSWYSQTASDWLTAVRASWNQGALSIGTAYTIHMHTYCMHTHKWMRVYVWSACASILLLVALPWPLCGCVHAYVSMQARLRVCLYI